MPLTEDDDMVEAIAPHRADEPFHEGILQPAHTLDNATQNSRSLLSNFGWFTIFL